MLKTCIFFVTSRCNSACRHCFYRHKLNRGNDLTLEEVGRVIDGMGRCPSVLFSGGEPFLRDDIAEVARLFAQKARTVSLAIPTNGLEGERISAGTRRIMESCPRMELSVNFSLDGMEAADAGIRGRQDAFSLCRASMERLAGLKKEFPRLKIVVNSVFTGSNEEELTQLVRLVSGLGYVDYHHIEPVRPESLCAYPSVSLDVQALHRVQFAAALAHEERTKIYLRAIRNPFSRAIAAARRLAWFCHLRYVQALQETFLAQRKNGIFACPAGPRMCVIDSDGEVRLCELQAAAGSLREEGYSLKRLFASERFRQARKTAAGCACTHFCFISNYVRQGVLSLNPAVIAGMAVQYMRFLREKRRAAR